MKKLVLFSTALVCLLGTSCNHYIGIPADPYSNVGDSLIDKYPRIFLVVNAEYQSLDDNWAVTMKATSGLTGYEVEQVAGATLFVNGEPRNLLYGFPFRGTPEKLYLSRATSSLKLEYHSPNKYRSSTSLPLGDLTSVVGEPVASKTHGLVVTISPGLRADEVLIAGIYEYANGSTRLLRSKTFNDVYRSTVSFNSSDFATVNTNGGELLLKISRSVVTTRPVLFSDGVKYRMIMPEFNQVLPVVE